MIVADVWSSESLGDDDMHVFLLIVSQLVSTLSATARSHPTAAAAADDDDSESDDALMDVDGQVHFSLYH